MKIKIIMLILLLSTLSLYGQYFYEDFTPSQKLDTAHAYLMVSEQFKKIGDRAQAEKYKKMALFIYPELLKTDPERLTTINTIPERIETKKPTGSDKSSVIRYYFSKLLRSITTGDLETADSLIAERLYIPEYIGGLTKAQLNPMIEEITNEYDLSKISPTDLYKLDSIKVVKKEESTYLLTIEGADNKNLYTSGITFFTRVQTFRFRQFDSGWKIDKISIASTDSTARR